MASTTDISLGRMSTATRRRATIVAAAALTAVVVIPVAFAVRGPLLELIRGEPAPPPVADTFASWNRLTAEWFGAGRGAAPLFPDTASSQARGVLSLSTPQGRVDVW